MNTPVITEIRTSRLMLSGEGIHELEMVFSGAVKSRPVSASAVRQWAQSIARAGGSGHDTSGQEVLVVPVTGVMTKYARYDFWSDELDYIIPGMDDVAAVIRGADEDKTVKGTILLMNTPGGTTQSWIRIEEVLRNRKKPCIAVIDGLCCSAGYYVAALCDRIVALNDICQAGSIGVMAQILDTSEAEKKQGIRIIEVYPPESKYKNKSYRDAIDGDTETLIREELSPVARRFQELVRSRRKGLNKDTEGVLEGRVFYAPDAREAGLIDDILTLDDSISLVCNLADERAEIINSIY